MAHTPGKTQAEPQSKAAPAATQVQQPALPEQRGGPARPDALQRAAAAPPPDEAAARVHEPELGAAERARAMRILQRSVGGARAGRMLAAEEAPVQTRPALAVTAPHDPSEREAETVAQRVRAGQPAPSITPLNGHGGTPPAARRGAEEPEPPAQPLQRRGEEPEPPAQPLQRRGAEEPEPPAQPLQRQAAEEPEPPAQPLQRQVAEEPEPPAQPLQRQAAEEPEPPAPPLQRRAAEEAEPPAPPLQRQAAEEAEPPAPPLQRQAAEEAEPPAPPLQRRAAEEPEPPAQPLQRQEAAGEQPGGLDTRRAAAAMGRAGPGSPLPAPTRAQLESGMGADLSAARVHSGSAAHEATDALHARAVTRGADIYLARGESPTNLGLMAHEATHVVQQGAAAQRAVSRLPAKAPAPTDRPAGAGEPAPFGPVDLKGAATFPAPADLQQHFAANPKATASVSVRFGNLARGTVQVSQKSGGKGQSPLYRFKGDAKLPLAHPLFAQFPEAQPMLQLRTDESGAISGELGIAAVRHLNDLKQIAPEAFGLSGFTLGGKFTNKLQGGTLELGVKGAQLRLGKVLAGTIDIQADEEKITAFSGKLVATIKGLNQGELALTRTADGQTSITGKLALALTSNAKNVKGEVELTWAGDQLSGKGVAAYQGDKFNGSVTFNVMEQEQAQRLSAERKAPEKAEPQQAPAPAKKQRKTQPGGYVVFGEGELGFSFTEWLTGTAQVILDHEGHLDVIGKITPQKEVELFPQRDYIKQLFKLEARAGYGIPVVGNIFIFANVSLDAFAKLGPAKLYKISIEGEYSTNPEKAKRFTIQGSLNISAAAGVRLRGEAGAGLEILAHDIKAGAGINAIAGVRGYAEATPILGYREQPGAKGEDKKGEFFIRGELEIAAQAFLGLGGDLFVEIDAPWWSPVPDKKWTWPLGNKEYPLGGSVGVNAAVDYVIGSNQWPSIEFKPVEFSADKFLTDLYTDKARPKTGEKEQKGAWKEKNEGATEPPKAGKQGDAKPGKAGDLPDAKPKVQPGSAKAVDKPVDPGARTADGKSVREHQEEARKRGGKPALKDGKAQGASAEDKAKAKDKQPPATKDTAAAAALVKSTLAAELPRGAASVDEVNKVLAGLARNVAPALSGLRAAEIQPGKPKTEGANAFKVVGKTAEGKATTPATVKYSAQGAGNLSHDQRWAAGVKGVTRNLKQLEKRGISEPTVRAALPAWQKEFGFTELILDTKQTPWAIMGAMSAKKKVSTVKPAKPVLVPTNVTWSLDNGRAGKVTAEPLTRIAGNTRGSTPKAMIPGWRHAQALNKQKDEWVRLHLLNHNLHGPGVAWNLTPGPKVTNSAMERGPESNAKQKVDQDETLFYETSVQYHEADPSFAEQQNFPQRITVIWGRMKEDGKTRDAAATWDSKLIPPPPKETGLITVNVNQDGRSNLQRFLGISEYLARSIIEERKEGLFAISDFEDRMRRRTKQSFAVEWPDMARALLEPNINIIGFVDQDNTE